jgi:hypothetical protein
VRVLADAPAAPGELVCETGSGDYHFVVGHR